MKVAWTAPALRDLRRIDRQMAGVFGGRYAITRRPSVATCANLRGSRTGIAYESGSTA